MDAYRSRRHPTDRQDPRRSRNPGLPKGVIGKIGVSVSPVDPNRVFAVIEAASGGVFRSDDAGATWKLLNEERKLRQRAFYYSHVIADAKLKDRVYVLNVSFFRSDDGGVRFDSTITVPHGDNHDLWIAPNDNQRMIERSEERRVGKECSNWWSR